MEGFQRGRGEAWLGMRLGEGGSLEESVVGEIVEIIYCFLWGAGLKFSDR